MGLVASRVLLLTRRLEVAKGRSTDKVIRQLRILTTKCTRVMHTSIRVVVNPILDHSPWVVTVTWASSFLAATLPHRATNMIFPSMGRLQIR